MDCKTIPILWLSDVNSLKLCSFWEKGMSWKSSQWRAKNPKWEPWRHCPISTPCELITRQTPRRTRCIGIFYFEMKALILLYLIKFGAPHEGINKLWIYTMTAWTDSVLLAGGGTTRVKGGGGGAAAPQQKSFPPNMQPQYYLIIIQKD